MSGSAISNPMAYGLPSGRCADPSRRRARQYGGIGNGNRLRGNRCRAQRTGRRRRDFFGLGDLHVCAEDFADSPSQRIFSPALWRRNSGRMPKMRWPAKKTCCQNRSGANAPHLMLPPPRSCRPRIHRARQNPGHCSHRAGGCKRMLAGAPPRTRARSLPRRRTALLDRGVERQLAIILSSSAWASSCCLSRSAGFALQSLQAVFLIVELLGITLRERALLGTSLERFQIFANALLVVIDRLRFVVALRGFVLEGSDFGLLLDDFPKRGFDFGIDRFLADEELQLIFVDASIW